VWYLYVLTRGPILSEPMGAEVLTDLRIRELTEVSKEVVSRSKAKVKGRHQERDFELRGADGSRFKIFHRQNTKLSDDFSCGIRWEAPSGESVVLARYNGSSHPHPNPIEGTRVDFRCHIHRATERYIRAGRQPETYAEETSTYSDLDGAVRLLAEEFHVSGLVEKETQATFKWN
jgi:hypothetical protein